MTDWARLYETIEKRGGGLLRRQFSAPAETVNALRSEGYSPRILKGGGRDFGGRCAIVDDSAVCRLLAENAACVHARFDEVLTLDGTDAVVAPLRQFEPDLILFDLEMRPLDGDVIAPDVRAVMPWAQVCFWSTRNDLPSRAKAFGAQWFDKEGRLDRLGRFLRSAVNRASDVLLVEMSVNDFDIFERRAMHGLAEPGRAVAHVPAVVRR